MLLIVLWLLGVVSSYTLGGFIHLLLVLAIAVVLIPASSRAATRSFERAGLALHLLTP